LGCRRCPRSRRAARRSSGPPLHRLFDLSESPRGALSTAPSTALVIRPPFSTGVASNTHIPRLLSLALCCTTCDGHLFGFAGMCRGGVKWPAEHLLQLIMKPSSCRGVGAGSVPRSASDKLG